jgi:hypothetical protein
MIPTKEQLYKDGVKLLKAFCAANDLIVPVVNKLEKTDRLFHLATCAFYRPHSEKPANGTIKIMVEKCAHCGTGGRAWSWPAYTVDRTPYGVLQHELGHHVDTVKTGLVTRGNFMDHLFSRRIWEASKEKPLTSYLGTDKETHTFYMEWFAEHFRLFVTNPDLLRGIRPKTYKAIRDARLVPVIHGDWSGVLCSRGSPTRILQQAAKKVYSNFL